MRTIMWNNDKLKSDLRSTICKLVSYGVAFAMTTGMFIGENVLKVQAKEYENTPKRKMIINTDLAADDAVAIMMAVADPNVEILGITVVAGNVSLEQAVDNTLMTLEVAGRPDIPVFRGADKPIDGKKMPTYSVFGTDGMGDKDLIHPTGKASEQSAKDFILSTLKMYPNEVEIVSLCPVTNLAECIKEDPETMRLVKRVWSMGSAGLGVGNATPVAEFNVYKDVAAYDIFLKEEIPTTIAGYDLCTDETDIIEANLNKMKKSGAANQFIADAYTKLADYKKEVFGFAFVDCADGVAMACVLWPDFVKEEIQTHAVCVTDSKVCYGEVVFYQKGMIYDSMIEHQNYNTTLITDVNGKKFVDRVIKTLKTLPSKTSAEQKESIATQITSDIQGKEVSNVGSGNPWIKCDKETIADKLNLTVKVLDEAKDVTYRMNESSGLAEIIFSSGKPTLEYTYRMKQTNEFEDISGLYYNWEVENDVQINAFPGVCKRTFSDGKTIDLVLWFDETSGVMYSLSTSAVDLDGFDITAIAMQLAK